MFEFPLLVHRVMLRRKLSKNYWMLDLTNGSGCQVSSGSSSQCKYGSLPLGQGCTQELANEPSEEAQWFEDSLEPSHSSQPSSPDARGMPSHYVGSPLHCDGMHVCQGGLPQALPASETHQGSQRFDAPHDDAGFPYGFSTLCLSL
jgi:hypothetical protein